MNKVLVFSLVGTVAALCTSIGFVPQIIKGFATRQLKDVSTSTLVLSAAGTFLWAVYGIYKNDVIIIIANVFTCSTVVALLIMQLFYSGKAG